MKTICLHHTDPDGHASGAVVRRARPDATLFEIEYGEAVPWELIEASDEVIIVDFSLQPDEMLRASNGRKVIWIDHHKTAIEALDSLEMAWDGLRSLDEAGCVLAWMHFFPDQPVPRALVLVGDRDIWRWAEEDTAAFNEAIFNADSQPGNDALWVPLLDDEPEAVAALIATGEVLYDARVARVHKTIDKRGFEVEFEGHKTLAVNAVGVGEMGAYIDELGYTVGYCYFEVMQEGELSTIVTLYSRQIDVSAIAKKFGGGGHKGAAGFNFKRAAGQGPFPNGANVTILSE